MQQCKPLILAKQATTLGRIALSLALLMVTFSAHAVDPINTTYFGNWAVEGYDTVAYFTENKAVEGSKKYQTEWQGANWRFSSRENLELFKAAPEKYAPQYGGYCAYAVSQNKTASIEPDKFLVHNGKLYLNYNKKINIQWLADRDKFIVDADKNWPGIVQK